MFSGILTLLAFITSTAVTRFLIGYTEKNSLLDIPNERSSHVKPTPRGGGLAIVLSFMFTVVLLYGKEVISKEIILTFTLGGGIVALVGFVDDLHHVGAMKRILVHFVGAGVGLYFLNEFSLFSITSATFGISLLVDFIGIIFLVWCLNLFNFMDGIDGIAATEAIFIALGAILIIIASGGSWGESTSLLLTFSAACSGFLLWNWPPAKIFLGDVGSGFLGIIIGFCVVMTLKTGEMLLCSWLILAGSFFIDATVTLLTRVIRGQRWYEAHRSHAYQILSRRWNSHKKVTQLVAILNVVWFFPLALLSNLYPGISFLILVIAYAPLCFGVCMVGAGRDNH